MQHDATELILEVLRLQTEGVVNMSLKEASLPLDGQGPCIASMRYMRMMLHHS